MLTEKVIEDQSQLQVKQNRLIYGDCLEVFPTFEDKFVDLVLCDLPYGTTNCSWDTIIPFDTLWKQYNRICKDSAVFVLFSSQSFTTKLINSNPDLFKYCLVWNKNVPTGMSQAKYRPMKYHEDICIFCKKVGTYNPIKKERIGVGKACYKYDHYCGESNHVSYEKVKKKYDPDFVNPSTVLDFKVVPNRNGKLHPTQKPVDLLEYLILTYSNENEIVLDNCMGSGSTCLAARNTNRYYIGIEKEEKYFKIAEERLNAKNSM